MSNVQYFWAFLYGLQHVTTGGLAYTAGPAHTIVYGGSAIQAFLVALLSHGQCVFSFGTHI